MNYHKVEMPCEKDYLRVIALVRLFHASEATSNGDACFLIRHDVKAGVGGRIAVGRIVLQNQWIARLIEPKFPAWYCNPTFLTL